MHESIKRMATAFMKERSKRRRAYALFTALALVVSLTTTYLLVQPASAMENGGNCTMEAHTHSEACYEVQPTCGFEESEGEEAHFHAEAGCVAEKQNILICTEEECEAHSHEDACYSYICGKIETEGHAHSEACYSDVQVKICTNDAEDHEHSAECYTTEQKLSCGKDEAEAHAHEDGCIGLTCGKTITAGHAHGEACYEEQVVYTCGLEEKEAVPAHSHTEECYEEVLICGLEEHIHTDACSAAAVEPDLICTLPEHSHAEECLDETGNIVCGLEEHIHTDDCSAQEQSDLLIALPEGAEIPDGYDDIRTFTSEDGSFSVAVYAPVDAIPEGAALVAEILAEDSEEYAVAVESLDPMQSYDGLIAMDIRFEDANGNEVEPSEPVYVGINALGLLPENADPESVAIQHHAEIQPEDDFSLLDLFADSAEAEIVVTTVADSTEENGVVELVENKDILAQDMLAAFPVESFSTFTISWNQDSNEYEIICIDKDGNELTPAESSYVRTDEGEITLDDVAPAIAGHSYLQAVVAAANEKNPATAGVEIEKFKHEDGWKYLLHTEDSDEWVALDESKQVYFIYEKQDGLPIIITDLDKTLIDGTPTVLSKDLAEGKWVALSACAPAVAGYIYTKAYTLSDTGSISYISYVRCVNGTWYVSNIKDDSQVGTYLGNDIVHLMYDTATIPVTIHLVDETGASMGKDVTVDLAKNTEAAISALVSSSAGDKAYNHARLNSVSGKRITDIRYDNVSMLWSYKAAGEAFWTEMNIGQSPDIYAVYMGNTFRGVTPPGVTVNLFNYSRNGTNNINTGHFIQFSSGDTKGVHKANQWTDLDMSDKKSYDAGVYQGIVKPTLDANGYPQLTETVAGSKAESLAYLFNPNVTHAKKDIYEETDYLFQLDDNGYYEFNADKNFARLVDGDFILYTTPTGDPKQKFAPFNEGPVNGGTEYGHFGLHVKTEFTMAKDGKVNGQPMVFEFSGDDDVWVFVDGSLILDMGGIHSKFSGSINFATGEVYIDHVYNGNEVGPAQNTTLYKMLKAAGKSDEWFEANMVELSEGNWTFKDYTNHTFDFFYMERGLGSSNCRIKFNLPTIPKNSLVVGKELEAKTDKGSEALVDFLTGELKYTFEVLKVNEKGEVTDKSMFNLSDHNNLPTYQIMENSTIVGAGTVNENGTFTLKAGQLAVFDGLLADADGQYVVREKLPDNLSGQYQGAEYDVVGAGGTSTKQTEETETVDKFTHYTTEPLGKIPDESEDESEKETSTTTVIFCNLVDTRELSKLFVTKEIGQDSKINENSLFKMKILLGGKNLAIGTPYVITDAAGAKVREGTVGADGIIQIKPYETIEVDGILQGTEVTVYEVNEGNYLVDYFGTITDVDRNATSMRLDAVGISGTVMKPKSKVEVTVTNSDNNIKVPVTISKTLEYASEGGERTFSFNVYRLNEQMQPISTTIPDYYPGIEITGRETDSNGSETQSIDFFFGFARNVPIGDYFYRVSEDIPDDKHDIIYDETSYIVKITVTEDSNGTRRAAVTGITKYSNQTGTENGENMETDATLAFINSKNGSLSLEKQVKMFGQDISSTDRFTFKLEISGEDNTSYGVYNSDDQRIDTITFDNGKATISVAAGKAGKITIKGLPVGKNVVITELNTDGYAVSWSGDVSDPSTAHGPVAQSQVMTAGKTVEVICINTTGPELPSTGGIGTGVYVAGGTALMIGASLVLMEQERRRRRSISE